MRSFFENKFAFAATVLAFAMAMAFNAAYGTDASRDGHSYFVPASVEVANTPTLPPDPWTTLANTPTLPPDPWTTLANTPTLPPDPWTTLANTPTLPPDPWTTRA